VSYNFSAIFVCISNEAYSHLSTGFGISTEPQMPIDLANNKMEILRWTSSFNCLLSGGGKWENRGGKQQLSVARVQGPESRRK